MKRFRFSLERVLDWRRQQEELECGRLAALTAEQAGLMREAAVCEAESRRARAACASPAALPAAAVKLAYDAAAALLRERDSRLEQAAAVEHARRRQRDAVLEARRKVRLLELLRAKRRQHHARLADREQEALAADLYRRNANGPD